MNRVIAAVASCLSFLLPALAVTAGGGALGGCAQRESESSAALGYVAPSAQSKETLTDHRVVLVTIDGARWQDVFEGSDASRSGGVHVPPEALMPRTYALLGSRGVAFGADRDGCGTVHTASGSNVSLPGYQEIFTGHPSYCLDNDCDGVRDSVLGEAARAGVPGVASIGSWEMLARAVSGGGSDVFVAVGRGWPAGATGASLGSPTLDALTSAGDAADAFPGHDGYRPDVHTAAIALAYYEAQHPALFHVGLGDTDEYGHRDDYPAYLAALTAADAFVGAIVDAVDASGEADKTTILVTPDHGRNSDFRDHGALRSESGRTFLLAFGAGVGARGIGCPKGDVTLADVAPTIRTILGLARDTSDEAGTAIDLGVQPL